MAYSHRMSQQFHGSQQHNRGGGRKKEDENDALMRLVSPMRNLPMERADCRIA